MAISIYSCLIALFWFVVFVLVGTHLRTNKRFSFKSGLWPLTVVLIAAALRLAFPFDLPNTFIIRSSKLFPMVRSVFMRSYSIGNFSFSLSTLLLAVWGIGACCFLVNMAVGVIKDNRTIHQLAAMPDQRIEALTAEILGTREYRLIISPQISTPSMAGWRIPVFVLPYYISTFSDDEIRLIIRHELRHFERHHIWIKMATTIFSCIFWWNFPLRGMWRHVNQLLESDCDVSIMKEMAVEDRWEYIKAIQESLKNQTNQSFSSALSLNLFETDIANTERSQFDIKQRVHIIESYSKQKNYVAVGAYIALVAVIWVASFFVIIQPASFPSEADILEVETVESVTGTNTNNDVRIINQGMFYKENDDGNYILYVAGKPGFDYSREESTAKWFDEWPIIK